MYFQQLRLSSFRNYDSLDLPFAAGINCITGKNGSGKTNILDALHFLALTKGFRGSNDKQAIQVGGQFFFVEGLLLRDNLDIKLQCNLMQGKTKKIIRNGVPLTKMSEHIGFVPLVAILPEDTELIHGGSAVRRKFMDSLISQYDKRYLEQLIRYEKVLEQRNALLRQFHDTQTWDTLQLQLWDEQLIAAGIEVSMRRQQFIQDFRPDFERIFAQIVSDSETPQVNLLTTFHQHDSQEWHIQLAQNQNKDRYSQNTSIGVHRDDLELLINGQSARHYGSQGQQKTLVIALKIAQYQLLERRVGVPPLLLLDDIFDKLDEYRLAQIASFVDTQLRGQIFITDTSHQRLHIHFANSQRTVQFHQVEAGQVVGK